MPVVLFVLMIVFSYYLVKPFLLALFFGGLLAYICYPLYRWMAKKINRDVSALLICLVVVIILLIPTVVLVNALVRDSYTLYINSRELLSSGVTLESCENRICDLLRQISSNPQVEYRAQESLKAITSWVIRKGTDFLMGVPKFLLNLFIVFMAMFFFLRDGDRFISKLGIYLNMQKHAYHQLISRTKDVMYAIVYGYGMVALMQGTLGAIGLWAFGISSPFFWGIVMAILSVIPFVGTSLVWGPAAVILFLKGMFADSSAMMYMGAGLFFYGLIVVSSLDNLIRPKLVGDKAKIHPAIILLGIFGGLALLGPIGFVVGPLVLSVASIMVDTYLAADKPVESEDKKS